MTAGRRGPALLQDIWLIEKMAHFDREVIPERRMHAKGWGAHGTFTVTHDITRYTKAKIFSKIGKQTPMFARFSRRWPVSAAPPMRNATSAAPPSSSIPRRVTGTSSATTHRCFFFRDPLRFSDLKPCDQARPAHRAAQRG